VCVSGVDDIHPLSSSGGASVEELGEAGSRGASQHCDIGHWTVGIVRHDFARLFPGPFAAR